MQAIDRFREAEKPILAELAKLEAKSQPELLFAQLLQAMQISVVWARCYLYLDDVAVAKEYVKKTALQYHKLVKGTISTELLGTQRAIYFHHTVNEADLWRFIYIRQWLSDKDANRDKYSVLGEVALAERSDFWNEDITKNITAADARRSTRDRYFAHKRDSVEELPKHLLVLAQSEILIHSYQLLKGLQAEIEAIERLELSYSQWEEQESGTLAKAKVNLAKYKDYVLLVDQEQIARLSA